MKTGSTVANLSISPTLDTVPNSLPGRPVFKIDAACSNKPCLLLWVVERGKGSVITVLLADVASNGPTLYKVNPLSKLSARCQVK
jgi:hypothetical protein